MIYQNLPREWYKSVNFAYMGVDGYKNDLEVKTIVTNSKHIIFKLKEIDCCVEELYMYLNGLLLRKWEMRQDICGSIHVKFNIEPTITIKWSMRK